MHVIRNVTIPDISDDITTTTGTNTAEDREEILTYEWFIFITDQ